MTNPKLKPPLQASVVDMDKMSGKMFEILLKQNGYTTTCFTSEQLDVRSIRKVSKDLLIFNVDNTGDKDIDRYRMKIFRELLRDDDLSKTKVIITSKSPDDEKIQSILNVNKLDGLVSLPLDAMTLSNILLEIKDGDPKRTVWRSSWK